MSQALQLVPVDIGHARFTALVDPDTAFWSLVEKTALAETLADPAFLSAIRSKSGGFGAEMRGLRFGLGLSAVYLNPTERCNLNCGYCYIPEDLRRGGGQMDTPSLRRALTLLRAHFQGSLPEGRKASVIFHGAEPLLCRQSLLELVPEFEADFRFGVQTNGTLLDGPTAEFLMRHGVGIGLSLDAATAEEAQRTRRTWRGEGVYAQTLAALDLLRGYPAHNVICTVTRENMAGLADLVGFLHAREVPAAMLNMLRCTLPAARPLKPADEEVFPHFLAALERSDALHRRSGRKLVVVNFANILLSILAPTARRLMCDLSPCGGGRSFFALAPDGGMYPCSEFIGLPGFKGGNLFSDPIPEVLKSPPFQRVTGRKVEDISDCADCAVRHFCGAPCPAEADQMNGGMDRIGAFCRFYKEQARYAFRLIADGRADDFLADGWDEGTETTFDAAALWPSMAHPDPE
ncbi:MAG TPA: peptide-modifying radical SAM enzyme CbpB [bacterium]|nr:peptide-modifying radical SAM enzyme CbpB [bacterium]